MTAGKAAAGCAASLGTFAVFMAAWTALVAALCVGCSGYIMTRHYPRPAPVIRPLPSPPPPHYQDWEGYRLRGHRASIRP